MAPIASESTITAAVPLHFGPIVPEVNSPWFKLWCYHKANSGPPSVLYPKGTRVAQLPDALLVRCDWCRDDDVDVEHDGIGLLAMLHGDSQGVGSRARQGRCELLAADPQ